MSYFTVMTLASTTITGTKKCSIDSHWIMNERIYCVPRICFTFKTINSKVIQLKIVCSEAPL